MFLKPEVHPNVFIILKIIFKRTPQISNNKNPTESFRLWVPFPKKWCSYDIPACQGKEVSGEAWEMLLKRVLTYALSASQDCLACSSGSFLRKLRYVWLPLGWIISKLCCGVVWKKTARNSETLNDQPACLWLVSTVSTLPPCVMRSGLWSLCGPVRLFWHMITNWIANPGH